MTPADPRPTPFPRAWDAFFFTPAPPRTLAVIRILCGTLATWSWLALRPDLQATLGSTAWADPRTVADGWPPGAWSLWMTVPDAALPAAWAAALAVLVAFTLGLATPLTAALAWAIQLSTCYRAPITLYGFDNVLTTWLLYLAATGAAGQDLSLDRLLADRTRWPLAPRRPGPTVSANIALRLIQLHLALIYTSAGLAKLRGTPWWDGTAVGMLLGNTEFRTFDLAFLAEHPRALEAATHTALALEILYPALVWLPRFRPWLVAGAIAMHLGIAAVMGLTEFSAVMIAGNLAFLPLHRLRHRRHPSEMEPAAGPRVESPMARDVPRPAPRRRAR
jgi:hypothetical protein